MCSDCGTQFKVVSGDNPYLTIIVPAGRKRYIGQSWDMDQSFILVEIEALAYALAYTNLAASVVGDNAPKHNLKVLRRIVGHRLYDIANSGFGM
jgi:oligoribonuclease (3'-5' exoribonuclease)